MKSLFITITCAICLVACKKDNQPKTIYVSVSNLTTGATYSVYVTDKNKGTSILTVENGNIPYNQSAGVESGEQIALNFHFSPGHGDIKLSEGSTVLYHLEGADYGKNIYVTVP